MTVSELPKSLEEYYSGLHDDIPVTLPGAARALRKELEKNLWGRDASIYERLAFGEYHGEVYEVFIGVRKFADAVDKILHWGADLLQANEVFDDLLEALGDLQAVAGDENLRLIQDYTSDLSGLLPKLEAFLQARPRHEPQVHMNFTALLSGFMEETIPSSEAIFMDRYAELHSNDEVAARLFELLRVRDALVENLSEQTLSAYVEGAILSMKDFPQGVFPAMKVFQEEFLVDMLWFRESERKTHDD